MPGTGRRAASSAPRLIGARIVAPRSELATARGLCDEVLSHALGAALAPDPSGRGRALRSLDWLLRLRRQGSIEKLPQACPYAVLFAQALANLRQEPLGISSD